MRNKTWVAAAFGTQLINANQSALFLLAGPATQVLDAVIERTIGDIWHSPDLGQTHAYDMTLGLAVIPTAMFTTPLAMDPFGAQDQQYQWLWTEFASRAHIAGAAGGTPVNALDHIHVDSSARRRMEVGSEVLVLMANNFGPNAVLMSCGFRILFSE